MVCRVERLTHVELMAATPRPDTCGAIPEVRSHGEAAWNDIEDQEWPRPESPAARAVDLGYGRQDPLLNLVLIP